MEMYKTLVFTNEKERTALGKYVYILKNGLGGCETPQLMTLETNMKMLKKAYPGIDFDGVELITLKVDEKDS